MIFLFKDQKRIKTESTFTFELKLLNVYHK